MNNKNFIIAMILSVAVMFIWSEFFAPKPDPEAAKQRQEQAEKARQESENARLAAAAANATKQEAALSENPNAIAPAESFPEQRCSISNDSLRLSYTTKGGKITESLIIKEKYAEKAVDLSIGLAGDGSFPELSTVFSREPDYEVESSAHNSVTFRYATETVAERKQISLGKDFNVKIVKSITNNGESPIEWIPGISFRSQFENKEILSSYNKKFTLVAQKDNGTFEEMDDSGDVSDFLGESSRVNWIGVNYGYFIFAVIAQDKPLNAFGQIDSGKNLSTFTAFADKVQIKPGETVKQEFSVYYGTKEREILKREADGLEKTITFGWTSFLAEPLLLCLNFFYSFLGNYGLAIILLTIVVKLLLWPLSNASYKSMSKMRTIQPKMKELQEKYKNDKETLNKEMMLLYQKEGINPLGGCFPMFIQMPVYIALYYMIQNAVELYGAPFLPFWLTDLSEKDPFYIIPILLGVLMLLQTKLSPQQGDNKQAKIMMYTMPVVFVWISLLLPSGLTLYWLVNTLLGIAQQFYTNKKYQSA
ncbi:membrane protein insertase YidC [bacterium]|nr:membrane protein insertase YidC [bacterium]